MIAHSFEDALRIRKKVFGKSSSEVADTMVNLAFVESRRGRTKIALRVCRFCSFCLFVFAYFFLLFAFCICICFCVLHWLLILCSRVQIIDDAITIRMSLAGSLASVDVADAYSNKASLLEAHLPCTHPFSFWQSARPTWCDLDQKSDHSATRLQIVKYLERALAEYTRLYGRDSPQASAIANKIQRAKGGQRIRLAIVGPHRCGKTTFLMNVDANFRAPFIRRFRGDVLSMTARLGEAALEASSGLPLFLGRTLGHIQI